MEGGRGSERVRLSGQWRPDPESLSVVSKDWAKWKGRGPSPGTGKNEGRNKEETGSSRRKRVLGWELIRETQGGRKHESVPSWTLARSGARSSPS